MASHRSSAGVPVFHELRGPTAAELEALLSRIIKRILRLLTRTGLPITLTRIARRRT